MGSLTTSDWPKGGNGRPDHFGLALRLGLALNGFAESRDSTHPDEMKELRRNLIRTFIILFILGMLCSVGYAASYTIGTVITELKLKDGRTLHNVTVLRADTSLVMAKWEGGRGTINSALLPDEVRTAFLQLVPREVIESERAAVVNGPTPQSQPESQIPPTPPETPAPTAPPAPTQISGEVGQTDGPEKVITGQVFVTSRDGTNFKLGAVTVYAFGAKEFAALNSKVQVALRPTYDFLDAMYKRASAREDLDSSYKFIHRTTSLRDQELTFFPDSPRTETDADGRFEIRLNLREPFVIVARASRSVGDSTEHYYWVVPSSKIRKDGKVLLSNNNMQE